MIIIIKSKYFNKLQQKLSQYFNFDVKKVFLYIDAINVNV